MGTTAKRVGNPIEAEFSELYLFVSEGKRTKVLKFKEGVHVKTYFLLGLGCSCLGMQKTLSCKHVQMMQGSYKCDAVPTFLAFDFVKRLATSLGFEFDGVLEGMPETVTNVDVKSRKKEGFEKAVGIAKIADKRFVVSVSV